MFFFFFFQAEDGIRDDLVTGVQTCALPICYLADEPVQACPPSASYRLRRLVRRNKGPVLAASLIFLALVGGIIGTTGGLMQAHDERNRATQEAERATKAAEEAKAGVGFLTVDLLGQANPDENAGDQKVTVEQLLDRAATKIADGKFTGRPETEASIRLTIGNTYAK